MCSVCGCGTGNVTIDQKSPGQHKHHGHSHQHAHDDHPPHLASHTHGDEDLIRIEKDILSKNDGYAQINRMRFSDHAALALNLVSSPGAGKTTLLEETVTILKDKTSVGVIEGDQQTSNDANRIRALDVPAVQVNTGRGCHLDAHMVGHAFDDLTMEQGGIVFIENVGNLVCPASFDLGEAHKVVILSVTEGDDKPLKYPDMFAESDILIISKIDLIPYVDFDVSKAIERAHRINPELKVFQVSARDNTGMTQWIDWIEDQQRSISVLGLADAGGQVLSVPGIADDA